MSAGGFYKPIGQTARMDRATRLAMLLAQLVDDYRRVTTRVLGLLVLTLGTQAGALLVNDSTASHILIGIAWTASAVSVLLIVLGWRRMGRKVKDLK